MQKVLCRGINPDTERKCDAVIFHTDGNAFVIVVPANERLLRIEADPPRIRCKKCGYKTKLKYQ